MNQRSVLALAALVAIAAAGFLLFNSSRRTPKINLHPYEALGAVTAEETSKLLGKQGSIVVVIDDPGDERDPVMDAQLRAFETALKQSGKITIAAMETVKMDALQRMSTGGALPADHFMRMLEAHRQASAFVLFIGFPALGESEIAKLREVSAKVIVASACLPGYRDLLRQRVFHLAIVPRVGDPIGTSAQTPTLREQFDQEYLVATPETAGNLPY